ncbi:protein of unknown function [Pararobbsia alpina]
MKAGGEGYRPAWKLLPGIIRVNDAIAPQGGVPGYSVSLIDGAVRAHACVATALVAAKGDARANAFHDAHA